MSHVKNMLLSGIVIMTCHISYAQTDFVNDANSMKIPDTLMPCALLVEDTSLVIAVFQFVQDRDTFLRTLRERYGEVPQEAGACWDTIEPYVQSAMRDGSDAAQGFWHYLRENDTTGSVARRLESATGTAWDFTKERITPAVRNTWQITIAPFLRTRGMHLRDWWRKQ